MTYAVRAKIFECVLLICFFLILALRQHKKTNECHIFLTFEVKMEGEDREGDKRDSRRFIAHFLKCIADFFHKFSCPATYENRRISHILNI